MLHLSIHGGFFVEAGISLLVLLAVVCWLMLGTAAPRWMLVAVVVVPTWVTLVQNLVFPDLFYAALLALMLLLLAREHLFAAALMMFPLMLTRESTSLTLLCFLLAAWSSLRWRDRIAAVVAAVAGSVVVSRLAAGAQPNVEHLPEAIYMLAKIPWNFLRNVLGVLPWSDANTELCKVPVWSFPFHFGPVHALGVCGVSFHQQLVAIDVTLGNFGLLPMLLVWLWWRGRRDEGQKRSLLLRFTLLYGAVSFLLAPVIGAGFLHLVGYAWPLFLVALPQLFAPFPDELRGQSPRRCRDGILRCPSGGLRSGLLDRISARNRGKTGPLGGGISAPAGLVAGGRKWPDFTAFQAPETRTDSQLQHGKISLGKHPLQAAFSRCFRALFSGPERSR